MTVKEISLVADADRRAAAYLESVDGRRVFPSPASIEGLSAFNETLPDEGKSSEETLELLDRVGSPATVTTNGPRYFGFVVGAALPVAAAAERLMLAWDQGAALFVTSPTCATVEQVAGNWMLDILDLPRESAVGFGTSASTSSLACLTAARNALLERAGWSVDANGLFGAPEIKVVVSDKVHVTIEKALRILGFGKARIARASVDAHGRIDPAKLPELDDRTILCLQAGEVNSGEFDSFSEIVPQAKASGAWVHIDGAFGLWARASKKLRFLTDGVEKADSWAVDGHKWLNTPYDSAMAICRDASALAKAMNSDAVYAAGTSNAQKNVTLEFSRRARGVPVWAALRTLGRKGVAQMIESHVELAQALASRLRYEGFEVLNRVVLNQIVVRGSDDRETNAILDYAQRSGQVWFGSTVWKGVPAFRISISSWRTTESDVDRLFKVLEEARSSHRGLPFRH